MLTERPTDRSLNLMPIAPDPICPACGSPIVSGSVVFYNDDHLTHIDCHNGILTDAADKIVAVLARHPAADFCHTCLAGELNIAHEADIAVEQLEPAVRRQLRSSCSSHWLASTIRAWPTL